MKCVKSPDGDKIMRVAEDKAIVMVKEGWSYCPKKEWKEKVRDIPKNTKKEKNKKERKK